MCYRWVCPTTSKSLLKRVPRACEWEQRSSEHETSVSAEQPLPRISRIPEYPLPSYRTNTSSALPSSLHSIRKKSIASGSRQLRDGGFWRIRRSLLLDRQSRGHESFAVRLPATWPFDWHDLRFCTTTGSSI